MSRKPDRPLAARVWYVNIAGGTHGTMTGMKTTLCGLPLPPSAPQGIKRNCCLDCVEAAEGAPILTPQMEADWWATHG